MTTDETKAILAPLAPLLLALFLLGLGAEVRERKTQGKTPYR
jgi:hypothetical protein